MGTLVKIMKNASLEIVPAMIKELHKRALPRNIDVDVHMMHQNGGIVVDQNCLPFKRMSNHRKFTVVLNIFVTRIKLLLLLILLLEVESEDSD